MSSGSGIYHIVFRADKDIEIKVGAAGTFRFIKGFYVYTGTAQVALKSRLMRHIKKEKTARWHIDYLSTHPNVEFVNAYYYEGEPGRKECLRNMRVILNASFFIPKFGSSDCSSCPSHLAGFSKLSDFTSILDDGYIDYNEVSGSNY